MKRLLELVEFLLATNTAFTLQTSTPEYYNICIHKTKAQPKEFYYSSENLEEFINVVSAFAGVKPPVSNPIPLPGGFPMPR